MSDKVAGEGLQVRGPGVYLGALIASVFYLVEFVALSPDPVESVFFGMIAAALLLAYSLYTTRGEK